MRRSRLLLGTATLAALALLVAACEPEIEEDPEDIAEEPDEPEEEPDEPEEEPEELVDEPVTLEIESWRSDDIDQWENEIIPAFEDAHPDIELDFSPTAPVEYDGALRSRLEGGTAGDIITLRSFDRSRELHAEGFVEPIDDLDGLDHFDDFALSAWQTADGETTFGVPMAAVMHGFYYNVEAFDELGLDVPETNDEFLEVLDAVAEDGTYAPLSWGTADEWIATSTAFEVVGPSFWGGEEGREALLAGDKPYTDDDFVAAWDAIDDWQAYFPDGFEAISYEDTQQLFAAGEAVVMPAGSWEISLFDDIADVEYGVFPPTVPEAGDTCYVTDHPDIGIGMNADTDHPDEVRTFLEWAASEEFAEIYANAVPGFFPLGDHDIDIEHEVASDILGWRDQCESTARLNFEDLTAGDPDAEAEARRLTVQMWNEDLPPEEVAEGVLEAVQTWYEPLQ